MVVDRLENAGRYGGLGKNFETAVRWLAETEVLRLAPGKYPIDGERVFASVEELVLSRTEPAFEAHHRYADIQMVLLGRERYLLGWEGREGEAAPGADFYPCRAEHSLAFSLSAGQFVIFLPGEMHAPGNPDGAPAPCKKLVVKVLCA